MKTLKPIPGFSRYGITQCARLFNLRTNRELRTSSVYRGYQLTTLVNDSGKRQGVYRHRLVALTHLPPPDNKNRIHVNHIDHTPGNDHVSNLEWCTPKENVEHAAAAGRLSIRNRRCESLDEKGVVVKYRSIAECATDNNVSRPTMISRLLKGDGWIWPCGKRYRLKHADDRIRIVVVRDLITNQITQYSQLQHAGLYQIQYLDELKPWRHVEDIFGELEMYTHRKVVVRFDADWSSPVVYESARICGYHNNVKKDALKSRLRRKGQHIWSDKYRYAYYSDLSEEQQSTTRHKVLQMKDVFNDYRKLQWEYPRQNDTCLKSSGVVNDLSELNDIKASRAKW